MSSNVRTGKSSIPGAGSAQTILEMLQVHDAGQASPNLHSPTRTTNNPRRAMPYPPAPESIAGSDDIPTSRPPKENPECASVELSRRFPPSSPLSGQVDSFDFAGEKERKKKTLGEECAEPTVLISRCHGLAFPSPQSCDHTTAYRCREARCEEALRSPVLLPLPRSSGADPSHLPFITNMSCSRCLEINKQALPPPPPRTRAHDSNSHMCADGKGSRVALRVTRVRGGGAACVGRKAALAMNLSIIVEDARISPSAGSTSPGETNARRLNLEEGFISNTHQKASDFWAGCTCVQLWARRQLFGATGPAIRLKTCIDLLHVLELPLPINTRTRTQTSTVVRLAIRPVV